MTEKGKLYRVTSYAYENTIDVEIMADRDGWLWVAEENQTPGGRLFRRWRSASRCQFRSVATGNTGDFLFKELEPADAE
jgi:hypothetical protein